MTGDRPHLPGARIGAGRDRLAAVIERLIDRLGRGSAERVEPSALQSAEILLDLYGEDIRARAFVTRDDGTELMLRPDFTVPVLQMHLARGGGPGEYVYCGPVWRRQEAGASRAREYLQAGVETFGGADAAAADAELLARVLDALGDAPVEVVTGDLGLARAAIDALPTSGARRAALHRHLWRPARFHALLQRFGAEHGALTRSRADVVAAFREGRLGEMMAAAGAPVGLRDGDDVAARVARLTEEAETQPLDAGAVGRLEAVLAVAGPSPAALVTLEGLAADEPLLGPAVARFAARLTALEARGIDPARLRFEASFGRTTLEYYDGFVFGAVAPGRPDLPPIASGGRYDALTRALGARPALPAVGGIVRPEALVALTGGTPWR